jgi:predicted secreted protein
MAVVSNIKTFATAPNGASAPDSITIDNGTFFVEYGNGADSTGASGSSTIVQYSKDGIVEHTYTIAGSVDGLKFNPKTGQIWALQNQDGNSTISLIDPVTHHVTGPLSFANPSTTRGFDDVVFDGNKVYLSYTNPNTGDPTLVQLLNGDRPSGVLLTSTILTDGATGFDTGTGKIETIPQNDPDSMKLAPNGDLILSSGDDGTIIDISHPGTAQQQVSFTTVAGVTGPAGLDDVIKPSATAGTFYLTDTKSNAVYSFHVSGLNLNDYYASVGSLKAFGQIDPTTGVFTPLVTAKDVGNVNFAAPHGVVFVPDQNAAPQAHVDSIKTFAPTPDNVTGLDSITIAGKYVFVEYGNGVDSTGVIPGKSTIIQYDKNGASVKAYAIEGSVDGLKFNPETGLVWALQNQDGNSSLTLIDPATQKIVGHFDYANTSASRGYDDVVFDGKDVFLSYTNPTGNGDPTIVKLLNGPDPKPGQLLQTEPVLLDGVMGYDTVTGKMEAVPQADPDSLKLAPNGDLILSSGDDGAIIDIQNPATAKQAVAFTPIQGIASGAAGGLDDVIKPGATSGTFLISDAKDGHVLSVHMSGLNPNDYYASVGAFGAFGQIDETTGAFTALVSASDAPGFTFGSPHGVVFIPDAPAAPAPQISDIKTFQAPSDGSNSPDSVAKGEDGHTFIAYGNGADSTGQGGSSTIVEYDKAGKIAFEYSVTGSVDGLKVNPVTGELWALQNQDGNPTLTLINPETHAVSAPLSFANSTGSHGFDDVVFKGDKVFLSETNPANPGDPTIVELVQGDHPTGLLTTKTVLAFGAMGLNTETGKMEVVPQNDPDSLKLAPNGDLLLSSGDDGTIIDISHPGTAQQKVSFTDIAGVTAGHAGLDDVIKPDATSGTFTLTDTATDKVFTFHATGLNPSDYYASVGSLHAFGEVDPTTGAFTPLLSADNAPGFNFSSPHGVSFTADPSQVAVHDEDKHSPSNTGEGQTDVATNPSDNFVFRDGLKSAADTSSHGETPHFDTPQLDHVAAGNMNSVPAELLQTLSHASGHDASVITLDTGEHINPADVSKQVQLAHASFDFSFS